MCLPMLRRIPCGYCWRTFSKAHPLHPMGSFFNQCVAVASNYAHSVHSYATLSQFKPNCAPYCFAVRGKSRIIWFSSPKSNFFESKTHFMLIYSWSSTCLEERKNTFYESSMKNSWVSHFLSKFGAIATKCELCAGTVHRYVSWLAFRRSCQTERVERPPDE